MTIGLAWSDDRVEIRIDGDFPNQMVALNKMLTRDPRSRSVRSMLIDVLDADTFNADVKLLGAIAQMDVDAYQGAPYIRVAVVTESAKMMQIVKVYATEYETRNPGGADYKVFPDRDAAREWLQQRP